jgi:hypothetical protein
LIVLTPEKYYICRLCARLWSKSTGHFNLKTRQKIQIIFFLLLICFEQSILAQDSLSVATPVKHKFKPETMRATMMAVSFPGLGQIYNRKYWKIPVVYIGFGALVYSAGFNSKNYVQYLKGYLDLNDAIPQTDSYVDLLPDKNRENYDRTLYPTKYNHSTFTAYSDALLRMVDYYKRYRDLSYIGIGAWYLISILDANVDASLFNYDISNNLDITFVPMQMTLPGGYVGAGFGVDLKVNF